MRTSKTGNVTIDVDTSRVLDTIIAVYDGESEAELEEVGLVRLIDVRCLRFADGGKTAVLEFIWVRD